MYIDILFYTIREPYVSDQELKNQREKSGSITELGNLYDFHVYI